MGTLGQKLDYLTDTKSILKQKINNLGGSLTDESTFRSYGDYLDELYNEMPKVTGEGTEITLSPTRKGRMSIGLKGNTSQDSTTGKNLLPGQVYEFCTITADGNKTYTPQRYCSDFIKIDNALTYYLSANTILGFFGVAEYDNDYNYIERQYWTDKKENIITNLNSNAKYIKIFAETKSGIHAQQNQFSIYKVQLEQNSTATDYEPYTNGPSPNPDYTQPIHVVTGNNTISIGNTNYPINLGSIELCKIGDYQDYIYKDGDNWYKHKAINKDNFNALYRDRTVKVTSYIKPGLVAYACSVLPIKKIGEKNFEVFCNIFSQKYLGSVTDTTDTNSVRNSEGIASHTGNVDQLVISIDETRLSGTSVEVFFNYITNLNPQIAYILNTPTTTQITDETLISQLDAIENAMSTTGTTTISQTNADLPFIISASALKPFTTETLTTSLTDGE